MTNEELALAAAQGDTVSLNKLYFAVAGLLYKLISRYFPYCKQRTTPGDLLQCGYFAVVKAVKTYSPDNGYLFSSYLGFFVKQVCYEELGFRKKQVDTISLDAPISGENEGLTLQDAISDPDADTAEYAELSEMQIIVRQEIERLPQNEQCVIYAAFYENKTMEEIASEFGWDYKFTRKKRYKAYWRLRNSEAIQALRKAYNWRSDDSFLDYICLEDFDKLFENSGLKPIGGAIWE